MVRPRFQVSIGTMMVAIAGIAFAFATAKGIGVLAANVVVMGAMQLVIYSHVRGRCRAEGRPYAEADRARFMHLWRWVGTPIIVVCFCLMVWLFPIVAR
jgi:hypothetical protein